ncbi:MAG: hypothetical protein Q7S39_03020 [Ignavibacteria bacterium]|nr:hypothetical protein [Ignavibacteria bacterium]
MFLNIKNLSLIILLLFLLHSCKDNPVNIENSFFSGITVTNENGIIISDDLEDWQPRYTDVQNISNDSLYLSPAYPNPAGKKFVSLNPPEPGKLAFILVYLLPNQSNVKITFNNKPDNTLFKLVDTVQFAGLYNLFFDLTDKTIEELPNGIYRVYFEMNEFKSYGDVEINR